MDEDNKVVAEQRETFGKGAARKIRAVGKIPAVLYGHGTDPQHLTLPAHQVGLLIRKANAVLDLQISGKSQIALVKDVQKDPVHQVIEHIDLIVIKRGEKVQVEVPVHVEGRAGESLSGLVAGLLGTHRRVRDRGGSLRIVPKRLGEVELGIDLGDRSGRLSVSARSSSTAAARSSPLPSERRPAASSRSPVRRASALSGRPSSAS